MEQCEIELDLSDKEIAKLARFAHQNDITINQAVNQILEKFMDTQMEWSRTIIRELLRYTVLLVTFTKKNGEERVMRCTLLSEHLPETKGTDRKSSGFVVFDLEKEQWRSISVDTISSIILDGPMFDISLVINNNTVAMTSITTTISNDDSVESFGTDSNLMATINEICTRLVNANNV